MNRSGKFLLLLIALVISQSLTAQSLKKVYGYIQKGQTEAADRELRNYRYSTGEDKVLLSTQGL